MWKLANIIPIPKPNKDTNMGTSYRPISLLSVVAKTLDKCLLLYITANITQCSIVAKELYTAKTEFYSNKIIDNQGDYKALFNITNTLLVNQNCATMPSSNDDSVLAELFSNFFVEKISKLRVNFTFDSSSGLDIAPLTDGKLDCLRLATSEEIQNTILSASNSSCALDPIPT